MEGLSLFPRLSGQRGGNQLTIRPAEEEQYPGRSAIVALRQKWLRGRKAGKKIHITFQSFSRLTETFVHASRVESW